MTSTNILVLRCLDLDTSRRFYEALGLTFTEEQHGKGSIHYACEFGGWCLNSIRQMTRGRLRI